MRRAAALLLLLAAGCAGVPAGREAEEAEAACPSAPLTGNRRADIVRLAQLEWLRFGGQTIRYQGDHLAIDPVGRLTEDDRAAYPCLVKYWAAVGEGGFAPYERCLAPWADTTFKKCPWAAAWSAAFASWVLVRAGFQPPAFQPSQTHSDYLVELRRYAAVDPDAPLVERPAAGARVAPGDLVCRGRGPGRTRLRTPGDITAGMPMHCDIVTLVAPDRIEMVGGNVFNAVSRTIIELPDGHLPNDDGNGGPPRWVAVVSPRDAS